MTWVDGVVLAVLLVSAGLAYLRGMVREVLGIGAWAGATLAGILAEPVTRPLLEPHVQPDWLATGLAVGGVFLLVLILLQVLIAWLSGKVQRSALGGLDRALGFVFGLARGAFVVVLAYVVAAAVSPHGTLARPVREARFLPLVADGAAWAVELLPPDVRPRLPDGTGRQEPSLEDLLRPPARNRT